MTIEEEIVMIETQLANVPVGVKMVKDAAGNSTEWDRASAEKRLDFLRKSVATRAGNISFGISRMTSGGANDA